MPDNARRLTVLLPRRCNRHSLSRRSWACMVEVGALRLSTPNLRLFWETYLDGQVPPRWPHLNPTRMINEVMRNWGQHVPL